MGAENNPIVFPHSNNFTASLLTESSTGYIVNHKAKGADLFRFSLDFGLTWTEWKPYENFTFFEKTHFKESDQKHVVVDYWCKLCGSSASRVYGEISSVPSIFPSLQLLGEYNMHGLDTSVDSQMVRSREGFYIPFVYNFPAELTFDIWGDGKVIFGDIDGDRVLDRLPPNSQLAPMFIIDAPPKEYFGWTILVGDDFKIKLRPTGSWIISLVIFLLLAILPISGAALVTYIFRRISYSILVNIDGNDLNKTTHEEVLSHDSSMEKGEVSCFAKILGADQVKTDLQAFRPKSVLIATLEYEIPDWGIKVRIGGLGVMSSLIGNNLLGKKLIWVVPMIQGKVKLPNYLRNRISSSKN